MADVMKRAKVAGKMGPECDSTVQNVLATFRRNFLIQTVSDFKAVLNQHKLKFEDVWTEAIKNSGWDGLEGCGLAKLSIMREIGALDGTSFFAFALSIYFRKYHLVFTYARSPTHFDSPHLL